MFYGKAQPAGRLRRGTRRLTPPVLLLVALIGWILLWALTNPPGAAPDEPSHYAKAVAAGRGQILGEPVPIAEIVALGAFSEDSLRQVRHAFRSFALPAELRAATSPPCIAWDQDVSAACLHEPRVVPPDRVDSIVGAYPPWFYIPQGILTLGAWSVPSAYVLARVGSALACAGLLAAGLWLLLDGRRGTRSVLLAGVAVAVTPMAVFLSSQVGGSGGEVVGALASAAAALRLSRADQPSAPAWWVAGGVLGVTALSRPMAPLWVLLALAIGLARLSGYGIRERLRAAGRPAVAAAGLTAAGIAGSAIWTQGLSMRAPILWDRIGSGLATAADLLPTAAPQVIGVFSWQSVPLPAWVCWLWAAVLAGLLLAAAGFGRRRDRVLLAGAVVVMLVAYELIAAVVFVQNGFGMQGRYVLPMLAMLPPLCVEVLAERLPRTLALPAARAAACVIAATAAGQFVAWAINSRRYAVGGHGPPWFLSDPVWSPPGGWLAWTALACLLVLLTVTAAATSLRDARYGYGTAPSFRPHRTGDDR